MKRSKKEKRKWVKPDIQILSFNNTLSGNVPGVAEGVKTEWGGYGSSIS